MAGLALILAALVLIAISMAIIQMFMEILGPVTALALASQAINDDRYINN